MNASVACPECGRTVVSGAGLVMHLRSIHGTKPKAPQPTTPKVRAAAERLVWEDPPRKNQGNTSTEKLFAPKIAQLRQHPKRWARLRTWTSPGTASSMRKTFALAFPDCEFKSAQHGDGSAIWGRYMGEPT